MEEPDDSYSCIDQLFPQLHLLTTANSLERLDIHETSLESSVTSIDKADPSTAETPVVHTDPNEVIQTEARCFHSSKWGYDYVQFTSGQNDTDINTRRATFMRKITHKCVPNYQEAARIRLQRRLDRTAGSDDTDNDYLQHDDGINPELFTLLLEREQRSPSLVFEDNTRESLNINSDQLDNTFSELARFVTQFDRSTRFTFQITKGNNRLPAFQTPSHWIVCGAPLSTHPQSNAFLNVKYLVSHTANLVALHLRRSLIICIKRIKPDTRFQPFILDNERKKTSTKRVRPESDADLLSTYSGSSKSKRAKSCLSDRSSMLSASQSPHSSCRSTRSTTARAARMANYQPTNEIPVDDDDYDDDNPRVEADIATPEKPLDANEKVAKWSRMTSTPDTLEPLQERFPVESVDTTPLLLMRPPTCGTPVMDVEQLARSLSAPKVEAVVCHSTPFELDAEMTLVAADQAIAQIIDRMAHPQLVASILDAHLLRPEPELILIDDDLQEVPPLEYQVHVCRWHDELAKFAILSDVRKLDSALPTAAEYLPRQLQRPSDPTARQGLGVLKPPETYYVQASQKIATAVGYKKKTFATWMPVGTRDKVKEAVELLKSECLQPRQIVTWGQLVKGPTTTELPVPYFLARSQVNRDIVHKAGTQGYEWSQNLVKSVLTAPRNLLNPLRHITYPVNYLKGYWLADEQIFIELPTYRAADTFVQLCLMYGTPQELLAAQDYMLAWMIEFRDSGFNLKVLIDESATSQKRGKLFWNAITAFTDPQLLSWPLHRLTLYPHIFEQISYIKMAAACKYLLNLSNREPSEDQYIDAFKEASELITIDGKLLAFEAMANQGDGVSPVPYYHTALDIGDGTPPEIIDRTDRPDLQKASARQQSMLNTFGEAVTHAFIRLAYGPQRQIEWNNYYRQPCHQYHSTDCLAKQTIFIGGKAARQLAERSGSSYLGRDFMHVKEVLDAVLLQSAPLWQLDKKIATYAIIYPDESLLYAPDNLHEIPTCVSGPLKDQVVVASVIYYAYTCEALRAQHIVPVIMDKLARVKITYEGDNKWQHQEFLQRLSQYFLRQIVIGMGMPFVSLQHLDCRPYQDFSFFDPTDNDIQYSNGREPDLLLHAIETCLTQPNVRRFWEPEYQIKLFSAGCALPEALEPFEFFRNFQFDLTNSSAIHKRAEVPDVCCQMNWTGKIELLKDMVTQSTDEPCWANLLTWVQKITHQFTLRIGDVAVISPCVSSKPTYRSQAPNFDHLGGVNLCNLKYYQTEAIQRGVEAIWQAGSNRLNLSYAVPISKTGEIPPSELARLDFSMLLCKEKSLPTMINAFYQDAERWTQQYPKQVGPALPKFTEETPTLALLAIRWLNDQDLCDPVQHCALPQEVYSTYECLYKWFCDYVGRPLDSQQSQLEREALRRAKQTGFFSKGRRADLQETNRQRLYHGFFATGIDPGENRLRLPPISGHHSVSTAVTIPTGQSHSSRPATPLDKCDKSYLQTPEDPLPKSRSHQESIDTTSTTVPSPRKSRKDKSRLPIDEVPSQVKDSASVIPSKETTSLQLLNARAKTSSVAAAARGAKPRLEQFHCRSFSQSSSPTSPVADWRSKQPNADFQSGSEEILTIKSRYVNPKRPILQADSSHYEWAQYKTPCNSLEAEVHQQREEVPKQLKKSTLFADLFSETNVYQSAPIATSLASVRSALNVDIISSTAGQKQPIPSNPSDSPSPAVHSSLDLGKIVKDIHERLAHYDPHFTQANVHAAVHSQGRLLLPFPFLQLLPRAELLTFFEPSDTPIGMGQDYNLQLDDIIAPAMIGPKEKWEIARVRGFIIHWLTQRLRHRKNTEIITRQELKRILLETEDFLLLFLPDRADEIAQNPAVRCL